MSEVIGMLGYGMIRTIFWILVTVLLLRFTILRKKKLYKILTVIVCIVGLNTLSAQFPIENLFFSFKSPESAFQYYHGGKMVGNIVEIVDGKSSSMMVFSENNDFGWVFITPETDKGYVIPSWLTVKKYTRNIDEKVYGPFIVDITIYRVIDTNDYFYYGSIITEEENVTIIDSNNVNVKHFYRDIKTSYISAIIFYGYIENLTGEYHFLIGDQKVSIDEQLKPGYNEK
jgi:hypothetical protein